VCSIQHGVENGNSTRLVKEDRMISSTRSAQLNTRGGWKIDTDCSRWKVLLFHYTPFHFI